MTAVEFEAVARDGRIEIPAEHAAEVQGPVRVIVLYQPAPMAEEGGYFDELMDNPVCVPGFMPLTRDEAHERR